MAKGTRLVMAIAATLIAQAATFQALTQIEPGAKSADGKPWLNDPVVPEAGSTSDNRFAKHKPVSETFLEKKSKAAAGDAQSQFNVGMSYLFGDDEPQSDELAFQWLLKAAKNGHALGQFQVGNFYDNGTFVAEDKSEAIRWYIQSIESGAPVAETRLGFMHKLGTGVEADPIKAAYWFGRAAVRGDQEAQFELGRAYQDGTGVVQDAATAAFWFEKSASQGNVWAQLRIGLSLMHGRGVPADQAAAVGWYKKAADQGNSLGQHWLGRAYEFGEGVSKNPKLAARWYRLAADQGSQFAQADLGFLYAEGIGVAKDEREAFRLFELSAAQSEPRGQYGLATIYSDGRVVKQNHQKAFGLYRLSAEQGYAPAQLTLGYSYSAGQGVAQNDSEAIRWYLRAANQGVAAAQSNLAKRYVRGDGVPQNYEEAYFWFSLAASVGFSDVGGPVAELRDEVKGWLSQTAVSRVQARTANWKPKYESVGQSTEQVAEQPASSWSLSPKEPSILIATGSAFIVSAEGYIVTNAHVVSSCNRVTLANGNTLSVLGIDEGSDLALLKLPGSKIGVPLGLRSGRGVQLGEDVVIAGFPLSGLLSSDLNVTAGSVSSLSGPGQDRRIFQLTAPVQSGNSGGPVLDMSGNVVGVVVAKLDALAVAEAVGDVPQNVNFAISLGILQSFLDSFGVDYSMKGSTAVMSRPKVAETARTATVQIECRS